MSFLSVGAKWKKTEVVGPHSDVDMAQSYDTYGDSIRGELNVHDSGFKLRLICTHTIVTPYLYKTRLTPPRRLFLSANEEHKQEHEERNMKLYFNAYVDHLK